MKLNCGCGEHYADGWVNLDLHRDGPRPDVIGSMLRLPFPDDSASYVFLGHVLEHIAPSDLRGALTEVRRVLAPDGEVMVVGPDIDRTRLIEPLLIDGVLAGGCRWPGDEHRWAATEGLTKYYLSWAGFASWPLPVAEVPLVWPVVDRAAAWQFAIRAKPRR